MLLHHDSSRALLSSITFLLLLPSLISAGCECGYALPSNASTPQVFYTDLLETDFLHLKNISINTDWSSQNYTVTPAAARGPWGKNASLSNVVTNPLVSKYDWAGDGVLDRAAGLEMYVRGVDDGSAGGLVGMAELSSVREDMLYGSFRASVMFTGIGGTCGAWFWVCGLSPYPVTDPTLTPQSIRSLSDVHSTKRWSLISQPTVLERHPRDRRRTPFRPAKFLLPSYQPRPPISSLRRSRFQRREHAHLLSSLSALRPHQW